VAAFIFVYAGSQAGLVEPGVNGWCRIDFAVHESAEHETAVSSDRLVEKELAHETSASLAG